MLPYLDIHTHRRPSFEGAVSVASLSVEELKQESVPFEYNCAGIHPWWLEDYSAEEIKGLQIHVENLLQSGKLWAIGETGIDRMYDLLEEQKELFLWHLSLAEKFNLPMVIHNVRSGSDLLSIMKEKKPTTAWIFHDYRGSEQLTHDLLRFHPNCFFSFGISVDNSPQVRELMPLIPLDHIFLETDAQKHLDIHDIYLRASETLKVDLEFLKSQIWLNFKKIH
jgi:TatD DNase family protein